MAPKPLKNAGKKTKTGKNTNPKPSSSQAKLKSSRETHSNSHGKRTSKISTQETEQIPKNLSSSEEGERTESESEEDIDEGPFPELFLSDDDEEQRKTSESIPMTAQTTEMEKDEEEDKDDDESLDVSDEVEDEELGSLLDDSDSEASNDPSTDNLDNLIARSSFKPDEDDAEVINPSFSMLGRKTDYMSRAILKPSAFVKGANVNVWDEIEPGYGSESSTEDAPNRIGNIPSHFYDDMPHIGYDINGKKIMRPAKGDELDKFLAGIEDPTSWTSVEDKLLQKNVALTDEELAIIHKLAKAENPDAQFDPYEPLNEFFTGKGKEMTQPLSGKPEPKRRFIPSKWEHKKVMKIVRAIRQGRIVPNKPKVEKPQFYGIWSGEDQPRAMGPMYMPAPKLKLPGHIESYNPPEEYLFDDDERKAWEEAEPSDRKLDFIPNKHSSLRLVPGYSNFLQERFERCLDLYLAPRMLRRRPKLDISDPSELLPKLPSPKDLRPFPSFCSIEYVHESGARIRTVSIDPTGMWVATGSDDGQVRVWECKVGRCAMSWKLGGKGDSPVYSVEWCPDGRKCILSVVVNGHIYLLSPLPVLSPSLAEETIQAAHLGFETATEGPKITAAKWSRATEEERKKGVLIEISVPGTPKQVSWHKRGDYFGSVATEAGNQSVLIHQLSKHQTQSPFKKTKGIVQKIIFHPFKPLLFVATQQLVKVYDLLAQTLLKTLQPGVKWISSLDVHPLGDNVIIGSYDKRLVWHDMDLSERPYKTLRYHEKAIRSVSFSPKFPLFSSTSDDGNIQIFHAKVFNDLMMNPLIVPLKLLKGAHAIHQSLGVLDSVWHPTEPWIISVGADGVARLWCS
ncbi:hypothetical protein PCANC_26166 [Puccinia coronata f. sp. avenae]|uniref:Ribosome biogenesis protein ERB1 n=1 Tax=Puccinia coronata f. sp. avenae TaxID=200324 RepID=A0A2N5RYU2_9BASI|nr:hypothetical protein PCANC_26166 [Puccinia coronata f. sp. avenae]